MSLVGTEYAADPIDIFDPVYGSLITLIGSNICSRL
jgi:hypothetical protein